MGTSHSVLETCISTNIISRWLLLYITQLITCSCLSTASFALLFFVLSFYRFALVGYTFLLLFYKLPAANNVLYVGREPDFLNVMISQSAIAHVANLFMQSRSLHSRTWQRFWLFSTDSLKATELFLACISEEKRSGKPEKSRRIFIKKEQQKMISSLPVLYL